MVQIRFNDSGELLIVDKVDSKEELETLTALSSATKMYWKGKRLVEGERLCMFKDFRFMPSGLLRRLRNAKQNNLLDFTISGELPFDKNLTKEQVDDFIAAKQYTIGGQHATLAEHQLNAVYTALKLQRDCIAVGTSGGKTFIAASIASFLLNTNNYKNDKKFLIIVPSQLLCAQGFNDFEDFQSSHEHKELRVYKIYSGAKNKYKLDEANVVFSTYQSLVNMPDDFFEQFNWVFVDEGHKAIGATVECIKKLRHCKYRFAFSGSFPELHTYEMLMLESFIGMYAYEFKTAKLRDAGFTSDFVIVPVKVVHSPETTRAYYEELKRQLDLRKEYDKLLAVIGEQSKLAADKRLSPEKLSILYARIKELRDMDAHKEFNRRLYEEEYLFSNSARLSVIASFVAKLDKNCLVLARRKNEVRGLYDHLCQQSDKNVHLIMGGVGNKDEIIKTIKNGDVDQNHLVGNVDMIGTGVSINELFYAAYCGIGKSPYTAIQTTGRLIRKHSQKQKAIIFDFYDDLQCDVKGLPTYYKESYSVRHSKERLALYKREDYEVHAKEVVLNV